MPTSALSLAQQYFKAKEHRLQADKVAAELKETETSLKTQLMDTLHSQGLNSVGDNHRVYAIVTSDEPQVEDWARLYAHVKNTGEFELLFHRINPTAVKERWGLHKVVPGVAKFPVEKLSVTKAKGAK
jgi:hypothetical protein